MIKNARQYQITRSQVAKLECALTQLTTLQENGGLVRRRVQRAQEDAMRSQIVDLREQLAEYEALRGGKRTVLALGSFEEFPRALVQARIAEGISQKELAKRLILQW
jgi:ribosome-binding protein aMBF1 (putative translation factor)